MTPDNELKALARDVAALAACAMLDRETDPRRVLPVIPSAALWRILPRLIRKAAPHMDEPSRSFAMRLADGIERGEPAPEIRCGKVV